MIVMMQRELSFVHRACGVLILSCEASERSHAVLQDLYRLPSFCDSGLPGLIDWAQGHALSFGVERSVRLRNRTLETHRCLLSFGLSPISVLSGSSPAAGPHSESPWTLQTVTEICESLGCPESIVAAVLRFFPAAGFIHFGFEATPVRTVLKCYLELPAGLENHQGQQGLPAKSRIQFLGYKWLVSDPADSVVTLYRTWSGPREDSTVRKFVEETPNVFRPFVADLQRLLEASDQSSIHHTTRHDVSYPLLEVRDEGGARCSWDLNIYDAQLQIGQLSKSLLSGLSAIATTDVMARWLETTSSQILGHLAVGHDNHANPFMTLYFGGTEDREIVRKRPAILGELA